MPHDHATFEEHDLPCVEAVLAGTLALMTGYSQALQAALGPQHRLRMGGKIADNLAMLVGHAQLSPGFRQVLQGLQRRWLAMDECTLRAAQDCLCAGNAEERGACAPGAAPPIDVPTSLQVAAPERLQ